MVSERDRRAIDQLCINLTNTLLKQLHHEYQTTKLDSVKDKFRNTTFLKQQFSQLSVRFILLLFKLKR